MKNILVLGGTGFVGRAICEHLTRRGDCRITVPTRCLGHARALQCLPTVVVRAANLHDDAALHRLVAGHDAVINLVAILHGNPTQFDQVHVQLPHRLAQACHAASVRRVIHVSALGVASDVAAAPSNYLRSKGAGEAVLKRADLDLTLLRPSVIFGAQDRFLNMFAAMQAVLSVIPLAGARAQFQPVWVEDVASAAVRALDQVGSIGQTIECAGPRVYTLADLVRLAGRWSGHERLVWPLPAAIARLQAFLMSMLPGEPLLSVDNLDSMRAPNIASGRLPSLDALGIQPAALEAIGPGYLGAHQGCARLDLWRAQVRR